MGTLSEWLKIMLGEIARKQDDQSRAAAELKLRQGATGSRAADSRNAQLLKGKVS